MLRGDKGREPETQALMRCRCTALVHAKKHNKGPIYCVGFIRYLNRFKYDISPTSEQDILCRNQGGAVGFIRYLN